MQQRKLTYFEGGSISDSGDFQFVCFGVSWISTLTIATIYLHACNQYSLTGGKPYSDTSFTNYTSILWLQHTLWVLCFNIETFFMSILCTTYVIGNLLAFKLYFQSIALACVLSNEPNKTFPLIYPSGHGSINLSEL